MKRAFLIFLMVLIGAVVVFGTSPALADTLTLNDGKTFTGKLISRSDGKVVFEIRQYGVVMRKEFQADKVSKITKGDIKAKKKTKARVKTADELPPLPPEPKVPPIKKYDGDTYYLIPLRGMVGTSFSADFLERALKDAVKRSPTVVILEIDSPGGYTNEVSELADVISKYESKVRMVAYVKRAISAAAITTLCVPEIYVKPSATIGGAYMYGMSTEGMFIELSEKMQSIWRAQARSCAEQGGHDPLLAEAMVDNKLELHVVTDDSGKQVKEGAIDGKAEGAKMLVRKEKLLTMTAGEAVSCGLAKAKVSSYDKLAEKLDLEQWEQCEGYATILADHQEKVFKTFETQMKKLIEDSYEHYRQAVKGHPANFTYLHYSNSKNFSERSKKKWQRRSRACLRHLRKSDKKLKKAIRFCESYKRPNVAEKLKEYRKVVLDLRKEIAGSLHKDSPLTD